MALPSVAVENMKNFLIFGQVNNWRYTNHLGETESRCFIPICLRFGSTKYHDEEQWLVESFDLDKKDYRTFALKDFIPR